MDGVPAGDDPDINDIGYYAPSRSLVFYYGDVGYWNGIVRIGRFTDRDIELIERQPDGFHVTIEPWSCGRATALRLASSLAVSPTEMGRNDLLVPHSAQAPLAAMNSGGPRWSCLYLAAVHVAGPNRSKGQCRKLS